MPIDDFISPQLPRERFYEVQVDPSCPDLSEMNLSNAHLSTLTLLIMSLTYVAGDIDPLSPTEVRAIEMNKAVKFRDGDLAPLCVYFRLSGNVAFILDAEPIPAVGVEISNLDLHSAINKEVEKVTLEKTG
jgi:hypothetical protein